MGQCWIDWFHSFYRHSVKFPLLAIYFCIGNPIQHNLWDITSDGGGSYIWLIYQLLWNRDYSRKVQTYFLRDPADSQLGTWTSETSDCLGNLSRGGYYCLPLNVNFNQLSHGDVGQGHGHYCWSKIVMRWNNECHALILGCWKLNFLLKFINNFNIFVVY